MLFDLQEDPQELHDLGTSEAHAEIRAEMHEAIFAWARRHHNRFTLTPERIEAMTGKEPPGIMIGVWDESDYERIWGKPWSERP